MVALYLYMYSCLVSFFFFELNFCILYLFTRSLILGVESVKPWGIIHSGCCGFRRKTQEKLSEIVNSSDTGTDLESLSRRVMELEGFKRFLEGNVIDTSLLENARNEQQKKLRSIRSIP